MTIDYMKATLKDMRLPRGKLLLQESGKEIEIPKNERKDDNGNETKSG